MALFSWGSPKKESLPTGGKSQGAATDNASSTAAATTTVISAPPLAPPPTTNTFQHGGAVSVSAAAPSPATTTLSSSSSKDASTAAAAALVLDPNVSIFNPATVVVAVEADDVTAHEEAGEAIVSSNNEQEPLDEDGWEDDFDVDVYDDDLSEDDLSEQVDRVESGEESYSSSHQQEQLQLQQQLQDNDAFAPVESPQRDYATHSDYYPEDGAVNSPILQTDSNSAEEPELTELYGNSSSNHTSTSLSIQVNVPSNSTYEQQPSDLVFQPMQQQQQQLDLMTPLSTCSSTFTFLSEDHSVPTELHRVQNQAIRRRREFQAHIHDTECRVAAVTAQLAVESMDRDQALKDLQEDCLNAPMDEMVERIAMERQCGNNNNVLQDAERRLVMLDSQMTHSIHVRLQDLKREQLDSVGTILEKEIDADCKLQIATADKREGSVVRQFETLVGTTARRYQEERAARIAAIQVATQQMGQTLDDLDPQRVENFVDQLRGLRQQLEQEKAEREAQDKSIVELIDQRTAAMKRAILEAVGDPC